MGKRIIVKDYNIYKENFKNNLNFVLLSDIHFSKIVKMKKLENLKKKIDLINPDYIFVVGDIVDSLNYINDIELMNKFYDWLYKLGNINDKIIPVLLSLGNHDFYYYNRKKQIYMNESDNGDILYKYYNNLNYKNVHLLNNSFYEDDYISVSGFTQPIDSYDICDGLNNEKKYFDNISKTLINHKNNKYNIALIHSPINLNNPDIKDKLKNFDLIMSGHMHNGMFNNIMDKLIGGHRGIIGPDKKFFPELSRGIIELDDNMYLIISGGVTKLQYSSGIFKYGNIFYSGNIEHIKVLKK